MSELKINKTLALFIAEYTNYSCSDAGNCDITAHLNSEQVYFSLQ